MDCVINNNSELDTPVSPSGHDALKGVGLRLLLEKAVKTVAAIGSQYSADYGKLRSLRERLEEGRFHLAVLGQFKRGKSTLLNALLGEALLPTSVVPLTAVPTFLQYGPELGVRISYQDDRPSEKFSGESAEELRRLLQNLVTEEGNPKNQLGVLQVEVFHPAPILQHGVVLIDTPGIGSPYTHNTEATLKFLPQCDAALFVVSADPPLTEVEAEFLKEVRSRVSRFFFVFNKVDYLNEAEKAAALEFFRDILREKIGLTDNAPIFCVSARRGLDARLSDDSTLWTQSGLQEIEGYLTHFLVSDKVKVLTEAISRKTRDALEEVMMKLRLGIQSLQMPLTQLEERLQIFESELKNAERQRIAAHDLLRGDRKRTVELLEKESEALRQTSIIRLQGVVEQSLSKGGGMSEQVIQEALAAEVTELFDQALGKMTRRFDLHVAETLRPHQYRIDELIESVRRAAAELFDIPYHAPESSEAFEMKRKPYWVYRKWDPTLPVLVPEEVVDRLLPSGIRKKRLKKRLFIQIDSLARYNVENLRWATLQNLDDAFRRFASRLDELLKETVAATHGAIEAAYLKRREHSESIVEDLARLESAMGELAKICEKIRGPSPCDE